MKKLILVIFALFTYAACYSQQCIVTERGDSVFCKIDTIIKNSIYFTHTNGVKDVLMIKEVKLYFNLSDNSTDSIPARQVTENSKSTSVEATILDMKKQISTLTNQVNEIKLHLNESHTAYRKGSAVLIIGGVLFVGSSVYGFIEYNAISNINTSKLNGDEYEKLQKRMKNVNTFCFGGMALGSLLSTIGIIIQIDSHKNIGFAGGYTNGGGSGYRDPFNNRK